MESNIKGGVILIGSLFWETEKLNPFGETEKQLAKDRNEWRNKFLDIGSKAQIVMPIRYGRCSESRACTYTMVFSKTCLPNNQGMAVAVPFIKEIDLNTYDNFKEMALELAKVEGINKSDNKLRKSWGCISIFINPLSNHKQQVEAFWKELKFIDKDYAEKKSLNYCFKNNQADNTLLDSDYILSNEIEIQTNCDFFFLTYIKPKHRNPIINQYPSSIEIASEIINSGYETYFIKNTENGITTFQDSEILSVLDNAKKEK